MDDSYHSVKWQCLNDSSRFSIWKKQKHVLTIIADICEISDQFLHISCFSEKKIKLVISYFVTLSLNVTHPKLWMNITLNHNPNSDWKPPSTVVVVHQKHLPNKDCESPTNNRCTAGINTSHLARFTIRFRQYHELSFVRSIKPKKFFNPLKAKNG